MAALAVYAAGLLISTTRWDRNDAYRGIVTEAGSGGLKTVCSGFRRARRLEGKKDDVQTFECDPSRLGDAEPLDYANKFRPSYRGFIERGAFRAPVMLSVLNLQQSYECTGCLRHLSNTEASLRRESPRKPCARSC